MSPERWFETYRAGSEVGTSCLRKSLRTLYCVTEGAGCPVKIGISKAPDARIVSFQMHTWREVFQCWQVEACSIHESALKYVLASDQIVGEWFSDPADQVKLLFKNGQGVGRVEATIASLGIQRGVSPSRLVSPRKKPHVVRAWRQEKGAA